MAISSPYFTRDTSVSGRVNATREPGTQKAGQKIGAREKGREVEGRSLRQPATSQFRVSSSARATRSRRDLLDRRRASGRAGLGRHNRPSQRLVDGTALVGAEESSPATGRGCRTGKIGRDD